jgi:hypothetical protein
VVRKRLSAAALALAVLISTPVAASAAGAGGTLSGPTWTDGPELVIPGPAGLYGLSVLSADDVWVVGGWAYPAEPLVAHLSGGAWTSVRAPDTYQPAAIDASSGEVWVAGALRPTGPGEVTPLLTRYAGGLWQNVPVTLPEGTSGRLTDIDMLPGGNGWAVGFTETGGLLQPLVLRSVAGVWQQVAMSPWLSDVSLSSVYATGPDNMWAVGTQAIPGGTAGLIVHWDGTVWQREPQPTPPPGTREELNAVSGNGSEVWTVGESCVDGPVADICEAAAFRREGQAWLPIQVAGQAGTELLDVVVISPADVWVFGYAVRPDYFETEYVEHWDGRLFSVVNVRPMPPPADFPAAGLAAAQQVPGTPGLWAVGWRGTLAYGNPNVMLYR